MSVGNGKDIETKRDTVSSPLLRDDVGRPTDSLTYFISVGYFQGYTLTISAKIQLALTHTIFDF